MLKAVIPVVATEQAASQCGVISWSVPPSDHVMMFFECVILAVVGFGAAPVPEIMLWSQLNAEAEA